MIRKNNKLDHKKIDGKIEKVLLEKYLPLSEKKKKFHIEDIIQLPKNVNPNAIYKKLDMDQRAYSEKFKAVADEINNKDNITPKQIAELLIQHGFKDCSDTPLTA